MAITLITGLPGNSKTLLTLREVIDLAARESRAVYFSGIKGLLLDDARLKGTSWTEIDPTMWHEVVPSGSIIFIDEAQKTFRSRSLGAVPPKHVTELEEHRHKGLDFFMVTQHPSLIDPAVRKLTQTHKHLVRIWGAPATTVHRWDSVRDNCDKPTARKDSESAKWVFDKTLYGLYHSADVHTMKFRVPGRVKLLVAVPFLIAGLGYAAYSKLYKVGHPSIGDKVPATTNGQGAGASVVSGVAGGSFPAVDPIADARAYVASYTPRVEGLPETAPRYDALTVPVRVPVPAMCIQIGSVTRDGGQIRCKCYSQQGTPMGVPFNMCVELAQGGRFQDFDADPRAQASSSRPDESARVVSVGQHPQSVSAQASGPWTYTLPDPDAATRPRGRSTSLDDDPDSPDTGPVNNRSTRARGGSQPLASN
jgi:zona occludens toxin